MGDITSTALPPDFIDRSRRAWKSFMQRHDITPLRGQVAAVEPESGRVWIGDDPLNAVDKVNADGVDDPVWFVRVGYDYLDVKGRR